MVGDVGEADVGEGWRWLIFSSYTRETASLRNVEREEPGVGGVQLV